MATQVQAAPFSVGAATGAWPLRAARWLWSALQAIGERRARRELTRLAASCEHTNPELAAQLRSMVREDWLMRG